MSNRAQIVVSTLLFTMETLMAVSQFWSNHRGHVQKNDGNNKPLASLLPTYEKLSSFRLPKPFLILLYALQGTSDILIAVPYYITFKAI